MLIVGAVGVVIAVALLAAGITASKTSFVWEQSNQAKGLALACAEEAMQIIRDQSSFEGSNNLTLGKGSCSYTVVRPGGEIREVTATGAVGTIIRKIEINATRTGAQTFINSWQEVADF
jgi:hypothetical protein